ncbi:MAG: ribonuclease H [Porphyromonadaceae bacterium CG2_30_38_12]|nr:MAG: ribonuclease H [Porphyromonadaceae bacterium CG2_30_38_12]
MSKKKKFFVVWDGYEPGIYKSWEECKKQTHGFGEAKFKGFETLEDAREAFLSPYWSYVGKNADTIQSHKAIANVGLPTLDSISVDGACSGNPGKMEYRGVYSKTKEVIFHQGPFNEGTNNIAEFLALVHALALLKQQGKTIPVYTDSITALAWLRKGKAMTKLQPNESNAVLFDLINRAEKWLANNRYNTQVLKWETEAWGEIPADFGRK